MLSTLVIIALQYSRRVFWFSFGHWLCTPWFFSRTRTRWSFLSFSPQKTFFFFLWTVIRDIFFSCSWPGVFCFFLVPWMLVDGWLVNIYIYIYIKIGRSTKRFVFFNLFIFFLHTGYIYVCFQLGAFVR